ncbi:hypothetical protein [Herbaspirillum robiniae]|uniref:hypothetical protein n=1 Tax=Herbaspirillum robiniae TaxID=2014887 RepID=UPI003D779DED
MDRSIKRFYGPEFDIKPEREEGRSFASMSVEPPKPEPHPLQVRLEQALGGMIRDAQPVWDGLPKTDRDRRVQQYRLLRDCLAHITGDGDPDIPSPWTIEESLAPARQYFYNGEYHYAAAGMLTVIDSKLVTGVRVAERAARRKAA